MIAKRAMMGTAALVLLTAAVSAGQAQTMTVERTVGHVIRSAALPPMEVSVASELAYLGPVRYEVRTGAMVEAFVFADTAAGAVRRAFVAHFEGYPEGVDHSFRYPRFEMATLGSHEYLNQTWAVSGFALMEHPAVVELLTRHGLAAGRDWLLDRYVRVVDSAGKHEVIFFYLESAAVNDSSIRYSPPGNPAGPPVPPADVVSALRTRARAAFQVTDR